MWLVGGGNATRDRSQLHPKWRTRVLTGKSCYTFKRHLDHMPDIPYLHIVYETFILAVFIASPVLQPPNTHLHPHPQRRRFVAPAEDPRNCREGRRSF